MYKGDTSSIAVLNSQASLFFLGNYRLQSISSLHLELISRKRIFVFFLFQAIQVAATRALSSLCFIASRLQSYTVENVSPVAEAVQVCNISSTDSFIIIYFESEDSIYLLFIIPPIQIKKNCRWLFCAFQIRIIIYSESEDNIYLLFFIPLCQIKNLQMAVLCILDKEVKIDEDLIIATFDLLSAVAYYQVRYFP